MTASLRGNAKVLDEVLSADYLDRLERPWMVVEDSSHLFEDSIAVLEFFHPLLRSGDYIIVEDGNLTEFSDAIYLTYEAGPNRAVERFLEQHPGVYENRRQSVRSLRDECDLQPEWLAPPCVTLSPDTSDRG